MKTLLFGVALFMSALTLVSFCGALLESALNRRNAEYGYSITALFITTILWTIFYHLN